VHDRFDRRDFLKSIGAGAASLALPRFVYAGDRNQRRPNIVIILADDMGYSDIGCYGGEIETPNIDRLAQNGLRFTQFYNTARCCPTRASLLTGLYPHQAGVGHMVNDRGKPGYRGRLNDSCLTIAEALRTTGYRTIMSGKWHVTPFNYETYAAPDPATWPLQRGFDRFYGTIAGGGSYFYPHGLMRGNLWIEPDSSAYYYTDAVSDRAAAYVERASAEDHPFFLYVAYTAPHWPLHALPDDIKKYEGRYGTGWDQLRRERFERMVNMNIIAQRWRLTERDQRVPPWEEAEHKDWHAHNMAVYAAQIDRMDQGIGRIVATLERTGRLENTLVFFLADNGGCAEVLSRKWGGPKRREFMERALLDGSRLRPGNDPAIETGGPATFASYGIGWANASNTPFRRYKHWVHEGGIATPLVVHWPQGFATRGDLRHQPGHLIDLMATCLDVAGVEYPKLFKGRAVLPPEGKSLVPAFDDKPIERAALFWEHEGNRAVRVGKWKLVAKGRKGPWELYDLDADRTETADLAGQATERVAEMAAIWEQWARRANVVPRP
jgi:arylsulfatase